MRAKKNIVVPRKTRGKGHEIENKTVATASDLYKQQQKIIEQFGSFDFDPDYDYKAARLGR
jgi:hypothetical protein